LRAGAAVGFRALNTLKRKVDRIGASQGAVILLLERPPKSGACGAIVLPLTHDPGRGDARFGVPVADADLPPQARPTRRAGRDGRSKVQRREGAKALWPRAPARAQRRSGDRKKWPIPWGKGIGPTVLL